MFLIRNHLRWTFALAAVLSAVGTVSAGWMGFRNDTANTLVIQESIPTGGKVRPGRLQKLFASETVRDTPQASGQRQFQIFDSNNPDKPIYSGSFPTPDKNENILYVIKSDGKGGLTIEALKLPVGAAMPARKDVPPPETPIPPAKSPPVPPIPPKKK